MLAVFLKDLTERKEGAKEMKEKKRREFVGNFFKGLTGRKRDKKDKNTGYFT